MKFGLLGPLLACRDGEVLKVPGGKQRALLAVLLLNAGRVVPVDELSDVLWGAEAPVSARVSVQNYVKRLRSSLGDTGHRRITTHPRGYMIRVGPGELDLEIFEFLLGAAREEARAGSWETAAGLLREGLSLWRGEPLADLESELLMAREVPRLAEMRLQAVEARIEADLHLGNPAELIAELQRLTAAHPLREHLHAQLMLAFYRTSRQGEALAAYQHARRLLIEELGAEPGTELRELHQRILSNDPALAGPEPGPPAGRSGPVPRELPAPVAHFAGRAAELAALTGLLDQAGEEAPGAVVISAIGGTAGVGKTALAVHWAHQVAHRFPDGQLYVNLRGFDPSGLPMTPGQAVRKFLAALGIQADQIPADIDAQACLYRSVLAGQRVLIVLDNARDSDQVRPLLPASPGSLAVVTSRSQLAGLVAVEGARPLTLDVLTETEARELLSRRLGAEQIAADTAAADELIRLCARLPLALAIAAARGATRPGLPLAAVTAELRDAHGQLDTLDAGDAATNIRAVFSWSCQSLTTPAARMFRLLGVQPGPDISAYAAASLAGIARDKARTALDELSRASLLVEHVPGRFAFHDLLRAYAAEQAGVIDGDAQCQAAIGRVLDHYVHSANAAAGLLYPARGVRALGPPGRGAAPEQFAGYRPAQAWFDAEYPVLIAATGLAAEAGFYAHAWHLPWTLAEFLDRRGHRQDWAATQRIALAAARRAGDLGAQGRAHRDLGYACASLGAFEDAHTHLRCALDICDQLGDQVGLARVRYALARLSEMQGDQRRALGEAWQALKLYRAAGHRGGEGRALNAVGWYHALLGDHRRALAFCEQAIALLRDFGDRAGEADAWDSLGYAHHQLGQHAEAVACYQRAVDPYRDLGDLGSQAQALTRIGDTYHAAGSPRAARAAWQQALALFDELGHPSASQVRAKLGGLGADIPASQDEPMELRI
jgi:DNA-binding SARP family transcriptional activator/tetratricopeptide (TPR) repeat protein